MRSNEVTRQLLGRLDEIDRKLDRIEVATLVRDPGNSLSADAYNGLRKQVVAANSARLTHLVQLSQIDLAARGDLDAASLRPLVEEWLQQSGLVRTTDTGRLELFEIVGGTGDQLEAVLPAYVDSVTGRIVRQGQARRVAAPVAPENDPAGSPASDERE